LLFPCREFNTEAMEEKESLIESLIDSAKEYGVTSLELAKLKALDKATDVISSFVPLSIVIILIASFCLFLSLGLSFWLGDLLGKIFYGFFVVAGFYILCGLILHFFLHKWVKKLIGDLFVKQMLK
jgi:hypothetical protein